LFIVQKIIINVYLIPINQPNLRLVWPWWRTIIALVECVI